LTLPVSPSGGVSPSYLMPSARIRQQYDGLGGEYQMRTLSRKTGVLGRVKFGRDRSPSVNRNHIKIFNVSPQTKVQLSSKRLEEMSNSRGTKTGELLDRLQAIIAHHKIQEGNGRFYPLPDLSPEELRHLADLAARRNCGVGVFTESLRVLCKACADEISELYGDEFLATKVPSRA
jgi:hypothetical protein